eukprot:TRINITY_DN9391_c0_g1_i1.p1 TRINITY_DN9391_c0_g1~~TRINITY_DN9391_c0_g1_i1.p1  ORF type:complete len:813 (+),score=108.57 TRINITY_DN9391_c0_g1_i1:119-2557(+)
MLAKGMLRGDLSNLAMLWFDDNALHTIDADFFKGATSLHELHLSNNSLASLPLDLLSHCPALTILDASLNSMSAFPCSASQNTALESLLLSQNKLTVLGNCLINNSPSMKILNLNSNSIQRLPSLASLPALTHALFGDNPLDAIADGTFKGLKYLQDIDLGTKRLIPADLQLSSAHLTGLNLTNVRVDLDQLWSILQNASLINVALGYSSFCDDLQRPLQINSARLERLYVSGTACPNMSLEIGSDFPSVFLSANPNLRALTIQARRINYLNVSNHPSLSAFNAPSIARLDISRTPLAFSPAFCSDHGTVVFTARAMLNVNSFNAHLQQLLKKCLYNTKQPGVAGAPITPVKLLDLSDNAWIDNVRTIMGIARQPFQIMSLGDDQTSAADGFSSLVNWLPVINMQNNLVQCAFQSRTRSQHGIDHVSELQTYENLVCQCPPQYVETASGQCTFPVQSLLSQLFDNPKFLVTFFSFIAGVTVILVWRCYRKKIRIAKDDLELHRGLLEDAEDEVVALKKGWEIDADQLQLVRRIDGESPGAFGEVWSANWDSIDVCVKLLRTEMVADSVEEFEKEVSFLRLTRHPQLVRFFGAGTWQGQQPFLVLELVAGGSLRSYLRLEEAIPASVKHRLLMDVALGMEHIHSLGTLHRDLKSGNVLVTETNPPRGKVTDFGSVTQGFGRRRQNGRNHKKLGLGGLELTAAVGTPLYMSLEVLAGAADYTQAADVWSYGILLYEVETQSTPDLLEATGNSRYRGPLLGKLYDLLLEGHRLPMGESSNYFQLFSDCMRADAEARPTFKAIRACLEATEVETSC